MSDAEIIPVNPDRPRKARRAVRLARGDGPDGRHRARDRDRDGPADHPGRGRGAAGQVIQRTYWTDGRPVETADIIVPVDRYEPLYVIPVDGE